MPGQTGAKGSSRQANADAIMTIIRRNNTGKTQTELEAIFKTETGVDWASTRN
jgi:hypothetical protein